MEFIDTHIHLTDPLYKSTDIPTLIRNSQKEGIIRIISLGTNLQDSVANKSMSEEYDMVYFGAGVHPHEADHYYPMQEEEFKGLLEDKKCVVVGEIGLDYYYKHSKIIKQKEVFRSFLSIAEEVSLPVSIHIREAEDDAFQIMKDYQSLTMICHSYTGSCEGLVKFIELGCYISFNGMLTFKKAENIHSIARKTPIERILLETDGPYLSPVPYRGKINEPKYLKPIIDKLAEIKGIDTQSCADIVIKNARKVFKQL